MALLANINIAPRKHRSYEIAAIRNVVVLNTAQTQFSSQQRRYASTLEELGPSGLGLIPAGLARGIHHSYHFQIHAEPTNYRLFATPTNFGQTGRRSFYSDATLVIRESWDPAKPAGPQSPEIR